jgi:hypothetical protein
MLIRSMMLMIAAVGCVGVGDATKETEETATVENQSIVPNFECLNQASLQVACVGDVAAILPITVNIKDVRVLSDSELDILSNDLNDISILNGDILNKNTILNNFEVGVLQDFLNKFAIDVTKNDIDVCTSVLGLLLCK